jgi:predicted NodU family carbamoyl transferase
MRHEGKITGLAAYGNPSEAYNLIKKMIDVKDGDVYSNFGDYYRPFFSPYSELLETEVKKYSKEDVAERCVKEFDSNDVTLNFMTATVNCTDEFQTNNPAVVHIHKTARPQIVTESSNNFIWNVLREWEQINEENSLVNTSFNVHEEPIICDVDEGTVSLRDGVIYQL